ELARADWIRDEAGGVTEPRSAINSWAPRISPLRRLWSSFFKALSRIAYVQARHIITLSDVNRIKQIADGAPPEKIEIVPNGVALHGSSQSSQRSQRSQRSEDKQDREDAVAPPARSLRV